MIIILVKPENSENNIKQIALSLNFLFLFCAIDTPSFFGHRCVIFHVSCFPSHDICLTSVIFKNAYKSTLSKISIVWCFFKSGGPICDDMYFNFIKNYTQNYFCLPKTSIFCIYNRKNLEYRATVPKHR